MRPATSPPKNLGVSHAHPIHFSTDVHAHEDLPDRSIERTAPVQATPAPVKRLGHCAPDKPMSAPPRESPRKLGEFERFHFPTIDSTQAYVHRQADQLFENRNRRIVVTADAQTQGRGSHQRRWSSPATVNVYATYALQLPTALIDNRVQSPHHTQVACLSVLQTLEDFGIKGEIKWVNDVLVGRHKIAGTLNEPRELNNGSILFLFGIGLNVNMDGQQCGRLDQPVTSMRVVSGNTFDTEVVLQSLSAHLTENIYVWRTEGFQPFANAVNSHLAFVGEQITVENDDATNPQTGVFLGVDAIGRVRLLTEDGEKVLADGRIRKEYARASKMPLSGQNDNRLQ